MTEGLGRCPLFEGLSLGEDLGRYCPAARTLSFRDKDTIYSQGEARPDLFCVLDGQVKLARVSSEGAGFTTALLSRGELFGPGLSVSAGTAAQEAATARGGTVVWRVPGNEFNTLLMHQPVLCLRLVEALGRRQQQLERRLACLALKRTEARLAETLRELSGAFETRCEHGFGQHLRITQQELADLVGASRPVVSSILNRLRDQGVLGYSREYVCVRGLDAIERLISE
jgi:CRP/FNR family cyclic AMP-dependent transcriptional regulator